MAFNRFRFSIALRIFSLTVSFILLCYSIYTIEWPLPSIILIMLIILQTYSLIRYVEQVNRDLKRFLDSIELSDFSQSFGKINLGPTFNDLKKSFDQVTQKFVNIRSEKEERFLYFQTVVEHAGIGLISYKPDGEIEFINKTALKLLNTEKIRNIKNLEKISLPLSDLLLKICSGEKTLFKLKSNGQILHLAINATQFKLKEQHYTLVSIQNIQSEVERERIARELEIGQEVQQKLLPTLEVEIPGIDLAGFCLPAKEIGGDYYDIVITKPDRLGIIIGDVSGKGLPAAIYMTLTKGILQASVSDDESPARALEKANHLLYRIVESGFFVSVLFAVLDKKSNQLIFARAGHNPLIYYENSTNKIQSLIPTGIALGLDSGKKFNSEIEQSIINLHSGDTLVFYTDGCTEAMNERKEQFGEEPLSELIKENHDKKAQEIINIIHEEVIKHSCGTERHDDMTMLILKVD